MAYKNKEDGIIYRRIYHRKNKDKIKKYLKKNSYKIKKQRSEHYQNNKESIRSKQKIYVKNNKEKIRLYMQDYNEKNKEKAKLYYLRNRKLQKPIKKNAHFKDIDCKKIASRLRNLLRKSLIVYIKTGKYQVSVKYEIDYEKILNHLKPFPKDLSKYHIDHIKPLCTFDLKNKKEFKKAFSPKNHQWLLAMDNFSKGSKY